MLHSLLSKGIRRKSVSSLQGSTETESGPQLKRVLSATDLFVAGLGCIIGAGIFVLTGVAAAEHAGPAIIVSFALAAFVCALVALAYAELASMIPVSGSAYTYAYATLGEFLAWIIGWDLLLEYAVGSSAVAVGWSGYLQAVLKGGGIQLPAALGHAPEALPVVPVLLSVCAFLVGGYLVDRAVKMFRKKTTASTILQSPKLSAVVGGALLVFGLVEGIIAGTALASVDILAVLIVVAINVLLVVGIKIAARATMYLVVVQSFVILLFIAIGMWHIDPANFTPFMPFGVGGIVTGAAIVFFAYIGFDSVTTLAEECKNPQRDLPRGILWSLVVCTLLYMVMASVMAGALTYSKLGTEAPVATVLEHIGNKWAVPIVSIGALAGLTSTLLVLLLGQSRIMMRMSKDGLLSLRVGEISPRFNTPVRAIVILGSLVAICAGILPIGELAELCNIGTLAAFVVVCLGVIILRYKEPERKRLFRCPLSPWLPALGTLVCVGLMLSLPMLTWIRFLVWMALGILIYAVYGARHSRLNKQTD
ncbi:MAG: amino acid permease [Candidatus Obscuribacterales bacterium]|nr:amino acid permease [Candidatus Obscuribacterales bacterium]